MTKDCCDYCLYYQYDEEYDEYTCSMYLDEDEYASLMTGRTRGCPYYRAGDDYTIVRKQN